jgi:type I restriction enzyme R subunit
VRKNVTIDWHSQRPSALSCVLVKRIPRKYSHPPDKQEKATQAVLEQAALFSEGRVAA